MTFLPIVERELQSASRRAATYRNRMLLPILVAGLAWLQSGLFAFPSATKFGRDLFESLALFGVFLCAIEGVRKTADCISVEKREGTLGLLFLTDLRGADVILGKLTASSLASLYGLLATLPILLTSLLLGSVTFGEVVRTLLSLLNILFFSLAVGMWVSARSWSASQAMVKTVVVLLIFLVLPLPMMGPIVAVFTPVGAFLTAKAVPFKIQYRYRPAEYEEVLVRMYLLKNNEK
jgi:ABC-type transport system involved in multi-copper enzyme maturation permease subunit